MARQIKEALPDVTLVMGGPHASTVPESFTACDAIDYVLAGEGEEALTLLADAMEQPSVFDPKAIPGLWWNGGKADVAKARRIRGCCRSG